MTASTETTNDGVLIIGSRLHGKQIVVDGLSSPERVEVRQVFRLTDEARYCVFSTT